MPLPHTVQILDDEGRAVDATFSVDQDGSDVSIVFASGGGAKSSTRAANTEYAKGLRLLLERLGRLEISIRDAAVETLSGPAKELPLDERRLRMHGRSYPLHLATEVDFERLRLDICKAQEPIAQAPGTQRGNARKRIRLYLDNIDPRVAPRLQAMLAAGAPREAVAAATSGVGERRRRYIRQNENPSTQPSDPFERDPNKVDRGLAAHATTQNALHDYLLEHGVESWSEKVGDPDYDISWVIEGVTFVGEVKSLPAGSEAKQLRLGLGQVLDYQDQLLAAHDEVVAVLVVEREPPDSRWVGLCRRHGVVLIWPGRFDELVSTE